MSPHSPHNNRRPHHIILTLLILFVLSIIPTVMLAHAAPALENRLFQSPVETLTPIPTIEWVNFYGLNTTLNGAPVPVGAVITAYDPDGVLCGQFVVHTAGRYGVMPVYRDDALTDADEGAAPGDSISFRINGLPATAVGPGSPVWTSNGDVIQVDLQAGGTPAPTDTVPAPTATGTAPVPTSTPTPGGTPPQWVNFYGINSTYEDDPLPVGAVVRAWSPTGVECGSFTVITPGQYGMLACVGAPVGLPGAHSGDTIYFTINDRAALTLGPDTPEWTTHRDIRHVELAIPVSTPTTTPPTATLVPTSTPTAVTPVPTGTSTPTSPAPTPTGPPDGLCSQGITYTVRWGDWLYKIARQFGVAVQDILYCNTLPNPNLILPGQQIFIPGVTPTPTPAPGATPTPAPGIVYIVRPGDTLSGIAWRYHTTVQAIMNANGLTNPNYIYVGQRLVIPTGSTTPPSGQTYVVQYGDTLWAISLRFGVNVWELAVANNLYYPYIIYPGQVLIIP